MSRAVALTSRVRRAKATLARLMSSASSISCITLAAATTRKLVAADLFRASRRLRRLTPRSVAMIDKAIDNTQTFHLSTVPMEGL